MKDKLRVLKAHLPRDESPRRKPTAGGPGGIHLQYMPLRPCLEGKTVTTDVPARQVQRWLDLIVGHRSTINTQRQCAALLAAPLPKVGSRGGRCRLRAWFQAASGCWRPEGIQLSNAASASTGLTAEVSLHKHCNFWGLAPDPLQKWTVPALQLRAQNH